MASSLATVANIAVATMLVGQAAVAPVAQRGLEPGDLVNHSALDRILEVGVRVDDPASLVQALTFPEPQVAGGAALLLYRFPGRPEVVTALQRAALGPEDSVTIAAIGTLRKFGVADGSRRRPPGYPA